MRISIGVALALGAIVSASPADTVSDSKSDPDSYKPLVTSLALQSRIRADALLSHATALEAIAYNTTGRNRLMGTPGHEGTVKYLYNQLTHPSLGGYYNVTLQPWNGVLQKSATGSLVVNGVNRTVVIGQMSPSGNFRSPLALVNNLGCNSIDYPTGISGKIALISRGTCTFAEKSSLAGRLGALGAVIFNNARGPIAGLTIGIANTTNGAPIPTVGISKEDGLTLSTLINSGTAVNATLVVKTVIQNVTTHNVLAETKYGNHNSVLVLGAHSDSVEAGPGINDDGSGLAGILEVAKQLASYRVRNSVRFGFWSGEEEGKLGSTYYVAHLSASEKKKIKMYLNFDMIASPNYEYGIFDGDGGDFNVTGPPGSDSVQKLFQDYFESRDLNHSSIALTGRSDYGPFQSAGIPVGGLATGAERNKTKLGVEEFGGFEGAPFDKNYHDAGDVVANLNMTAFLVNTQAIAHGVATYGKSFRGVNFNTTSTDEDEDEDDELENRRRSVLMRAKTVPKRRGMKVVSKMQVLRSRRDNHGVWL